MTIEQELTRLWLVRDVRGNGHLARRRWGTSGWVPAGYSRAWALCTATIESVNDASGRTPYVGCLACLRAAGFKTRVTVADRLGVMHHALHDGAVLSGDGQLTRRPQPWTACNLSCVDERTDVLVDCLACLATQGGRAS